MLSASAHAAHAVRSSSPLNPRSSSPPPSSPTPGGYSSLSGTPSRLPAFGRSNTTPTPLSARYRTTPNSSLASRRPGLNGRLPSSPGEFFSPDTTPTESAMWRDKFARRLADSQRRRNARDADLARRRGTEPLPDMDDPDAEERAMQEDEEVSAIDSGHPGVEHVEGGKRHPGTGHGGPCMMGERGSDSPLMVQRS